MCLYNGIPEFPALHGLLLGFAYFAAMQAARIEVIGKDLAIKWADDSESFISLEALRRHCPCAGCKGEMDVMGNLYKAPTQTLTERSFDLQRLGRVGGYGIQPAWADGHNTGIYSFEYLKRLADASPS